MALAPIKAWLLATMLAYAPPEKVAPAHERAGWGSETPTEMRSRFESIVEDLVAVTYDPNEASVDGGRYDNSRKRTAALLLALAAKETGFARDADIGPCRRRGPKDPRCDRGASACLMQVKVGGGTTLEGWTREQLFEDRQKCFRAGLHKAQRSFRSCLEHGPAARLRVYASGNCFGGKVEAAERQRLGDRFYDAPGRPRTPDAELLLAPPAEVRVSFLGW